MAAEDYLRDLHPDWNLPGIEEVLQDIEQRSAAGEHVLPAKERILRAFATAPQDVKVVIVGQDPYPTPGHSVGLAFSAELPAGTALPKSLANIYTEYSEDLGLPRPTSGDLSPWIRQGVLLLNRVLTVRAGAAGSHRGLGWEAITDAAIAQVSQNGHLAGILWGRQAQQFAPILGPERCVQSPHPSPLSAYRGFFGSRPFTRANQILTAQGAAPVDWTLEALG